MRISAGPMVTPESKGIDLAKGALGWAAPPPTETREISLEPDCIACATVPIVTMTISKKITIPASASKVLGWRMIFRPSAAPSNITPVGRKRLLAVRNSGSGTST
jgi:hypothetical protein